MQKLRFTNYKAAEACVHIWRKKKEENPNRKIIVLVKNKPSPNDAIEIDRDEGKFYPDTILVDSILSSVPGITRLAVSLCRRPMISDNKS